MSHRKNLRGAITFAEPKTESYLTNYDRIFGKKDKDDKKDKESEDDTKAESEKREKHKMPTL